MARENSTPLVLLHGVGLDRSMWGAFREEYARLSARETIALDLPGHGSQPPWRGEADLAVFADDVAARLPRVCHLVGFSLGALIAQTLAVHRPDRVASLTSVSSVCRRNEFERASVAARREQAIADFPAAAAASIDRWYPAGTGVDDAVVDATRRVLLANDVESFLAAYGVFATGDAEIGPDLGRIGQPALNVTGELDPGSTPEMTRRLTAAIPGARAVVVPGARHMLPVQCPRALAETIHRFIDESST
ncbi:alpha/beta fold hydrolase [Zhihengliuella halotolerans]|uniref:alpha/beta fold hydrolase n=1 Tax=Zhihengliuella halotolerans TaxID=370736 RepID=UPI000C7FD250|nr:alpha/beta fold hydrolase [Zhihengliuella halotolerans]